MTLRPLAVSVPHSYHSNIGGPFVTGRALRIWLVAFLTLVVVAIGSGIYILSVSLSDDLAFRQGDAAYYIVVTSKTVRDFPRYSEVGQVAKFIYSARDGTAPGQIVMTYSSKGSVGEIDEKYQDYCERQGYSKVPNEGLFLESRLGCDASDYRIEVDFQQRSTATSVTVVFIER